MKIYYKCHCMADEAEVDCPDRTAKQNIGEWIEDTVGKAVNSHHAYTRPRCIATYSEYVKIPATERG